MHILLPRCDVTVIGIARFLPDVQVKSGNACSTFCSAADKRRALRAGAAHAGAFVPVHPLYRQQRLWLTELIEAFEIKSLRALLTSAAIITVANWLFQCTASATSSLRLFYFCETLGALGRCSTMSVCTDCTSLPSRANTWMRLLPGHRGTSVSNDRRVFSPWLGK
jgi:hypothetical protein